MTNTHILELQQLQEEENINSTCTSQEGLKIRNLGRWNNKIYYFDDKFPVSTVKAMAIRSKFLIPKFVTSPPSFPTKLDNSIQSKNKRDRWALFILTHFKPWSLDTFVPCENPNWDSFCDFLQSLVQPNQPSTNLSTILIILNIAHGLKVSNTRKRLQETWRARATKTWDELTAEKTLLRELHKTFPTKFGTSDDNQEIDDDDDDDEHVEGIKYEHDDKRCENSLTVEEEYSTILMAEEKSHSKELQVQNYIIEAKNHYNDLLKNCIKYHKQKYAIYESHNIIPETVTVNEYIKSTNDFSTCDETGSTRIDRTIELLKIDENMTDNENVIVNTTTSNDDVEQTYEMNLPNYDDVPDLITTTNTISLNSNMLDNQQKVIFDKLYNLALSNLNNYINGNNTTIDQELEVVLGGPGSGKSFVVKVLMHTLQIYLAERKREALLQLQDLDQNDD